MKLFKFNKEYQYYYYKEYGYEICLEPCLNGFDVALYKNQDLQTDKICTLVKESGNVRPSLTKAIKDQYASLLELATKDKKAKLKVTMEKLKSDPEYIFGFEKKAYFPPY